MRTVIIYYSESRVMKDSELESATVGASQLVSVIVETIVSNSFLKLMYYTAAFSAYIETV